MNKSIDIINVMGINDTNTMVAKYNGGSIVTLKMEIPGNNNFLRESALEHYKIHDLIIGGEAMNIEITLPKNAIWFNSISIPETNIYTLKKLSGILKQISVPIINHPDHILGTTRDKIAHSLSHIDGVIVPYCLKVIPNSIFDVKAFIAQNNIPFPFLFRCVLGDGEESLVKIDSYDEMYKLECFAFDGKRGYYISEFIDYVSTDGLYRKMRLLVIGEKVIARHLILSSSWQIHKTNESEDKIVHKKKIDEEAIFLYSLDSDRVERCMEIKKRLKLDYFGIDCSTDSKGRLIVFEVNAHSMIGTEKNDDAHQNTLQNIRYALDDLIEKMAN